MAHGDGPFLARRLRPVALALLLSSTLVLGGCHAVVEGAWLGAWLGAVIGGDAEGAAVGAAVGAGVGAIIDAESDRSHRRYYIDCRRCDHGRDRD